VTPEVDFRPDRSMEHAARIQSLLKQVKDDR
jgi:ribosome-binding factor A